MANQPDDDGDYVEYHFWADAEEWTNWKQSLDKDTTLADRLRALIRADAAADGGLVSVVEDEGSLDELEQLNLLRLKLGRCHARASVASESLRDGDTQSALVTVDKIIDIAEPFARET